MSSRSLARILCLAAAVGSPFLRHQREARALSKRCSCEERVWAFSMTHCENRGWSSYSPECVSMGKKNALRLHRLLIALSTSTSPSV